MVTGESKSATCVRSAVRRPSSTRKGARSACRAASTSADPRRAKHRADVKCCRVFRRQLPRGRALALEFPHLSREACRSAARSEEHTSELQSRLHLVCRLLLEKKKK